VIQIIEECALNAWPSHHQILYDGWILRFTNGYTQRANSVNPVYNGTQAVDQKIQRCIQIYLKKNLRPIFRITPLAQPQNLDEILAGLGFYQKSLTSVQTLNLDSLRPQENHTFHFWSEFSTEWLEHFTRLKGSAPAQAGAPAQTETHQTILSNILPEKCFAILSNLNQVVTCGLGVLEGEHVGLFDIITAQSQRRKGLGQKLVLNILHWAKENGAKQAYLQVETNNEPALNLYAKLGFEEVYRYWYRVKE
jgi:ribosomal protein S18 acetylase RimI-like enzyme